MPENKFPKKPLLQFGQIYFKINLNYLKNPFIWHYFVALIFFSSISICGTFISERFSCFYALLLVKAINFGHLITKKTTELKLNLNCFYLSIIIIYSQPRDLAKMHKILLRKILRKTKQPQTQLYTVTD